MEAEVSGKQQKKNLVFNKEQLKYLRNLLSNHPVIGNGSVTHSSKFTNTLSNLQNSISAWIIDSGASDYMTGNVKLFKTYNTCHKQIYIRIADGSLSKMVG